MKYIIYEGYSKEGKYNAGSKAREDIEHILTNLSFKPFKIPTNDCIQKQKSKKIIQYFGYIKNYFIWKKHVKRLHKSDVVVIQYPIMFTFGNVLKWLHKKGVMTIAIIHDIESIRLIGTKSLHKMRADYEDKNLLKLFDKVISHNGKMTSELLKYGIDKEKIINLGIFDYLYQNKIDSSKRKNDKSIIIAGNLSSEKAYYLKKLNNIRNVKFNLYGKGVDFELSRNIEYKGCFLPSELPQVLEGSFGLVWDGKSIDCISGSFGNYMKYNNPHKISLYLASEIPVIVSTESALSNFVIENKIGIAVKSLKELEVKIGKLSKEEYDDMLANVRKLAKKIRNGYFLTKSINTIIK